MAKSNSTRLTDKFIRSLKPPEKGNAVYRDSEVPGFGIRITANDKRAFVLDYRIHGRNRRITLKSWPEYNASAARDLALDTRRQISDGIDPLEAKHSDDMASLCDDVIKHVEASGGRPSTMRNYRAMVRDYINPTFGGYRVKDITVRDVEKLHKRLSDRPYQANRVLGLLKVIFNLGVKWEVLERSPAKGVKLFQEPPRERYLSKEELKRLLLALDASENRNRAACIALMLLTGCRKTEATHATWDQFNLEAGVWIKPASTTKQKRLHRVPLNPAAIELLESLPRKGEYVFQGRYKNTPILNISMYWRELREQAGLPDVRLHDLRHTYASLLASQGLSLPIIGQLLGHAHSATTQRYAHLLDEPLRIATDGVGKLIEEARG